MSSIETFVRNLSTCKFPDVFNPYSDICPDHDLPDAAAIRRRNLRQVLSSAKQAQADSMWFGRDLGYRGGRRTGLAFTDEPSLELVRSVYANADVKVATGTGPIGERSARAIWKIIQNLPSPPVLWNVFPFHPYERGDSLSNRRHSVLEAKTAEDILDTLLHWFSPKIIVAIGEDAHKAVTRLGCHAVRVRHPSYGGQAEFFSGMKSIYRLPLINEARVKG